MVATSRNGSENSCSTGARSTGSAGQIAEKGLTLVPLQVYFKQGKAKVELGLAKGKTSYDKRETLKERDADREIERALKRRKF